MVCKAPGLAGGRGDTLKICVEKRDAQMLGNMVAGESEGLYCFLGKLSR